MNALNRLAVWLILASVTTYGGEGLSISAPATIGNDPVLVGIINLPGFERCLVNVPNSSKSALPSFCEMAKREQTRKVEVVTINSAEGRVEFRLGPEKRSLVLGIINSPPVGISFQGADLCHALELYGEFKGRNILCPVLDQSRTLTLRAPAKTKLEAAEAIEAALKEQGFAVVPDGTKFVLVAPQAQAASAVPRSSLIKPSTEKAKQSEVIDRGAIRFYSMPIVHFASIYADFSGRKLEDLAQNREIPRGAISFENETPLTKEELRYAFDTVLALNGFQMVEVGEKGIKLVRKVGLQK